MFSDCVKRMHLRGMEVVEYCKRRELLVMKRKMGYDDGVSIEDTSNEVFVTDYVKHLVCVYSSEGDFIRKFGKEQLNRHMAFVYLENSYLSQV